MGRWIKIYGEEQPTKNEREERYLQRCERVVLNLQLREFAEKAKLTEKQKRRVFAYGTTLQWFGRMHWLNSKETREFDYLAAKRFLKMLDYKGTVAEFEKTTEDDELAQYVKNLPKRHMNTAK